MVAGAELERLGTDPTDPSPTRHATTWPTPGEEGEGLTRSFSLFDE